MPNMVELVKRAAVEAVEAGKPVSFLFGQVISVSPLKIQVDQKATYTGKMLVLTRNVTDFEVDISVSSNDEDETYTHKEKIKIYNALIKDDWVLLGRMQGGKKFIVLDRIRPIPRWEGDGKQL